MQSFLILFFFLFLLFFLFIVLQEVKIDFLHLFHDHACNWSVFAPQSESNVDCIIFKESSNNLEIFAQFRPAIEWFT